MTEVLERRAADLRRRVLVRSWEYRQRHHARGVWFRLRRVLADASAAFVVTDDEARALVAEGFQIEAVGRALEPPKVILLASADRVRRLVSARAVPVRLGRELLEAEHLVLTRF
ncbi:MAG: hypothetical protein AB1806_11580 [Acidobacteriota bacterium]